ncbi:MAG: c-type cytochrome [Oceanicaulis sp.]
MRALAILLLALLTAACGQRMIDQEKQETWEAETAALGRHPPEGSIARGEISRLQTLATRPEMTLALIERGRTVYDRVCALCHGRTGRGDGIIVARGFPAPPSYHSQRLSDMAPAYVVEVITEGYGVMYPYANRVAPEDRWAVAAYVQALQRLGAQVEPVMEAAGGAPAEARARRTPSFSAPKSASQLRKMRGVDAPSPPHRGGEGRGEGERSRPGDSVSRVSARARALFAGRIQPKRAPSPLPSPPWSWGRGGGDAAGLGGTGADLRGEAQAGKAAP